MSITLVASETNDTFCWRVVDTNGYGYDFATYEEAERFLERTRRQQRAYVLLAKLGG